MNMNMPNMDKPDCITSQDKAASGTVKGVHWQVYESPMSTPEYRNWNGYARLDEALSTSSLDDMTRWCNDRLDVHGGITFCDSLWAGFDTMHFGDYTPMLKDAVGVTGLRKWTLDEVIDETKTLALEIAGLREVNDGLEAA